MEQEQLNDQSVSEIDAALAQARARKEKKNVSGETHGKSRETVLTPEEKEQRKLARAQEREQRKAERDAARDAKRAEKEANRKPAHMSKVNKAAERLTPLSQQAQLLFNEATVNLSATDVATLALHLQHFNRVQATKLSGDVRIEVGQQVKIVGGDPRFVGRTGTVTEAKRIRCFIAIEGIEKPVYLFTADVRPAFEAPADVARSA